MNKDRVRILLQEIRQQIKINNDIMKRDHPEGPASIIPHSIELLNSHITDKLTELEQELGL